AEERRRHARPQEPVGARHRQSGGVRVAREASQVSRQDHREVGLTIPDDAAVAAHVAAFESELAQAKSARDAQSVRDRYLGRKNSVVASWMQLIASAPPDQKKNIGRYANELKQAVEARWTAHQESAVLAPAGAAGSIDITLPG